LPRQTSRNVRTTKEEEEEEKQMDYNTVLNRQHIVEAMSTMLHQFQARTDDLQFKKGIYVYGATGSGKTRFVVDLLQSLNYDVVRYDAAHVRNKSLIDTITCDHVSSYNVLSMMRPGKAKRIAIVMDEIDGMNGGDKGGITSLIKLIRQKKTKRQKAEHVTKVPIVCIGNYLMDKKIKELMKVCHVFELHTPTTDQMTTLFRNSVQYPLSSPVVHRVVDTLQGDLRKLSFLQQWFARQQTTTTTTEKEANETEALLHTLLLTKSPSETTKETVRQLFAQEVPFEAHNTLINETDRTTIALLWHENVIDGLATIQNTRTRVDAYVDILDRIGFADYTDRITFQNQIWIFNEMSSLMKTMHANHLYHQHALPALADIRFTKVLTKYSTEYNNSLFLASLSQSLHLDKKDMIAFFQSLRLRYGHDFAEHNERLTQIHALHFSEKTDITKLDIKRLYRYLDKSGKKTTEKSKDILDEDDDIDDDDYAPSVLQGVV
jgi:replication factor C subunit 1